MSESTQRFAPPPVGGSSLFVIFAVLCLTVFAGLSLATVESDRRTADAAAQAVSDYYRADTEAETILAQLRAGTVPPGVRDAGNGLYDYSCAISDTQELQAEVWVDAGRWEVRRWQAVSTAQWTQDDTLQVWDGSSVR